MVLRRMLRLERADILPFYTRAWKPGEDEKPEREYREVILSAFFYWHDRKYFQGASTGMPLPSDDPDTLFAGAWRALGEGQSDFYFGFSRVEQIEATWGPRAGWPPDMLRDLKVITVRPGARVLDGYTQSVFENHGRLEHMTEPYTEHTL